MKFQSGSAQKIYNDYIKRVSRCINILSAPDQLDILNEIRSHIYEGMNSSDSKDEVATLLTLLEKLGMPEEYLMPIVTNKKISQASRTFNPKYIFQALRLTALSGIKFFIFGILYLFLFLFPYAIVMKIISPEKTGVFLKNGEFYVFGQPNTITPDMTEVLGNWFIPIMLVLTGFFYVIITLLFRLAKRVK